jgi:N-acyl-D-amino-acid deacylase
VHDLLELAHKSGVRLQLSHQIFVGRRTWRTYPTVLRALEQAVDDGVDVAFDAFPYTLGNSEVSVVFPDWFLDGFSVSINDPAALRRLKWEINLTRWLLGLDYDDITLMYAQAPELAQLEGVNFGEIARRLGLSRFEAYIHVARLTDGKARVLINTYSGDDRHEEPLRAVLGHPLCAFMTDTILTTRGRQNPASFGTFPRILGYYSRDLGLFPLEEAVRRMTSFPADRMGLSDVGRIVEGAWGDLVLFAPETVADNTTPAHSDAPPSGIQAVLISGRVVAQEGRLVSPQRWGRVLRNR